MKRLQSDLKASFDARADSNFHLEGNATVHLFGVGGRTVEKLRRYDLHVVRRLAPDVVILEVGTNDISEVGPEVVGSSIEELVSSLLDAFFGECGRSLPCHSTRCFLHRFLQRAAILNNYVRVVLEPFPNAFCWTHKDFSSPHKDLCLDDGVHVNSLGQFDSLGLLRS